LYDALVAAAARAGPSLPGRLIELLAVPEGSRLSELERLRRAPRRSSGPEMVKALQRVEDLAAFRVREVDVDEVPNNRLRWRVSAPRGPRA